MRQFFAFSAWVPSLVACLAALGVAGASLIIADATNVSPWYGGYVGGWFAGWMFLLTLALVNKAFNNRKEVANEDRDSTS